MNYFKVYQSFFENESYRNEMTDSQKAMNLLILSEFNKQEAKEKKKNGIPVMKFSHNWLASALSVTRRTTSKINDLAERGLFSYHQGFHIENTNESAPSMITDLASEDFFVTIDRYTFEIMLFEFVKNKKLKHRHIVVYVICKYIEQFKDGKIGITEFGNLLGLTVKSVKYSRIKPFLEDLKELKLITFDKKHGKIENIKVMTYELKRWKQNKLREDIRLEAESMHLKEKDIAYKEASASIEDLPVPQNFDEIIILVKDIYAKRTERKAKPITNNHRSKILSFGLSTKQIYEMVDEFFKTKDKLDLIRMNGEIFANLSNFIQIKMLNRYLK